MSPDLGSECDAHIGPPIVFCCETVLVDALLVRKRHTLPGAADADYRNSVGLPRHWLMHPFEDVITVDEIRV